MHQALYRKYRPQTFSDVCGQDHISNTLKTQIAENRFTHAYLFTGSRGTGKTSSAKILAKAVNCLHPVGGDPCNECENCRSIDNGDVFDVVEMDAASNRTIGDIRELQEQIEYAPSKVKFKVYIIDEVHMLVKEAFNALLKTLEEPPKHVIFILATTEVWAIPPTILSRCQRYDFNRISVDEIAARLKYVCMNENIEIEDNAAMLIAKLSDGGMRDALSLLDLCAGNSSNITETLVADSAGLIGKEHLFKLVDIIEEKDAAGALKLLDELYASSCDVERLFIDLISHYRDLLVAKTSSNFDKLITGTNEDIAALKQQADRVRFESILYCSQKLSDSIDNMKGGASKRIAAETALIRLCTGELDGSNEAILKRIGEIENKLLSGNFTVSKFVSEETPIEVAEKPQEKAVVEKTKEEVKPQSVKEVQKPVVSGEGAERFTKWAEVKEVLKTESLLYASLEKSTAYIDGKYMLIDAPNPLFLELIRENAKYKDRIRNAIMQITGVQYVLGPYNKKTAAKQKNDPLNDLVSMLGNDVTIEE